MNEATQATWANRFAWSWVVHGQRDMALIARANSEDLISVRFRYTPRFTQQHFVIQFVTLQLKVVICGKYINLNKIIKN